MKHIITLLVALMVSVASYADVVRTGNIITVTKTASVNESKSTGLYYQDKQGKQYPIYQSKKGKFYIIRTSSKTGKEYKYYLPKDIQETIKKEVKS